MQRTGTESGLFVAGNPQAGQKGSKVSRDWLNSVQEEIAGVIEAAGIELDPNNSGQLLAAIGVHAVDAVHQDAGGSGATFKLAFRVVKADDGSFSLELAPIMISTGDL